MADNIKRLPHPTDPYIEEAKKLCLEASEMGFVEVVVVGRLPNGEVAIQRSPTMKHLEFLGALEWAKHISIRDWGDSR